MVAEQNCAFQFNPYGDWVALVAAELSDAGYALDPAAPNDEVARAWLNVCRRYIEPRKRTVFRASDFDVRPEEAAPVKEIERRSVSGENLNRYLSKSLFRADYRDMLLFDWGIHHFHLSVTVEPSGFVARSARLLFANVTKDSLYLIAIKNHRSWTDGELVDIIHRNWPETIDASRLRGLLVPSRSITQEERADLRRAGVQTLVHADDGTTYGPLGGGYATDRSSLDVTQDLMNFKHYFCELGRIVWERREQIRDAARAKGVNPEILHLRLIHEDEQPFAQDDSARLRISLPAFRAS